MNTNIDEFATADGNTEMKMEQCAAPGARRSAKRIGALALLALATLVAPLHAWATCTVSAALNGPALVPNYRIYEFPGFTLNVTAAQIAGAIGTPIGPPITMSIGNPGLRTYWKCTSGSGTVFRGSADTRTAPTDIVYPTTIPGIGYKITSGVPPPYYPVTIGSISQSITYADAYIQFYKTANTVGSGSFSGYPITAADGSTVSNTVAGAWSEGYQTLVLVFKMTGAINIIVNNPACTVTAPNPIPVPMGTAGVSTFSGIGTTSTIPKASFNITLHCSAGDPGTSTPVSVGLTDLNNPTNTSDLLPLDPSSSASGVAIRVYNGANAVHFGPADSSNPNKWAVTTMQASGGDIAIPLTAAYVQTDSTINAGTVKAYATFTMTYQ